MLLHAIDDGDGACGYIVVGVISCLFHILTRFFSHSWHILQGRILNMSMSN